MRISTNQIMFFTLVCLGLMLAVAGLVVGFAMRQAADNAAQQIERLVPVNSLALQSSEMGAEVLVEGVISSQSPAVFRNFVAYVREEYRGEDADGKPLWVEDERMTPNLIVESSDGLVQVAADTYALTGKLDKWREPGLEWDPASGEGTHRYLGLVAGDTIVALGSIVQGPRERVVSAATVYVGTKSDYVAAQRTNVGNPVAVWVLIVAGLLLIMTGMLPFLRRNGRRFRVSGSAAG
jgi:uncharacterized membrane protein